MSGESVSVHMLKRRVAL